MTETCDWLHPTQSILGDDLGKTTWERRRCDAPAVVLATIGYRRCAEHARLADGWRLTQPHITDIVAGDFNPYADESFALYRTQATLTERMAALLRDRLIPDLGWGAEHGLLSVVQCQDLQVACMRMLAVYDAQEQHDG